MCFCCPGSCSRCAVAACRGDVCCDCCAVVPWSVCLVPWCTFGFAWGELNALVGVADSSSMNTSTITEMTVSVWYVLLVFTVCLSWCLLVGGWWLGYGLGVCVLWCCLVRVVGLGWVLLALRGDCALGYGKRVQVGALKHDGGSVLAGTALHCLSYASDACG